MKSKCLFILCDGLGDRLTEGKTPLESAKTPNIDSLSEKAICGIMDSVGTGVRPGSDTSHLSIFGYDPYEYYTGRGAFEASGVGINLQEGDVAFRCNFATLEEDKIVDRRAGRYEKGLEEIAKDLNEIEIDGIEVIFKKAAGHRAALVLRGKEFSSKVSDVDPHESEVPYKKCKALESSKKAEKTAGYVNKFIEKARELMADHPANIKRIQEGQLPANILLARGAGVKARIPLFDEKYGMKSACISGTTLIKGVCRELGMDLIEAEGATGHVDSNIENKIKAAKKALEGDYEFVFLHIKGTDEVSHDGSFEKKKEMIERVDKEVISVVEEEMDQYTVVFTGDHSTPLSIQEHSADPVPLLITGDVRTDQVKEFHERECAKGGLHRICGINLMGILMDIMDRIELFGA